MGSSENVINLTKILIAGLVTWLQTADTQRRRRVERLAQRVSVGLRRRNDPERQRRDTISAGGAALSAWWPDYIKNQKTL